MNLTIHQLTQEEADTLMKTLDVNEKYYQNFYEAFHDERRHVSDRDRPWALSEHERVYYLIESYLFGVNFGIPDLVSLASFARILPQSPRHKCAFCLKLLLKETLIPFCRDHKRLHINASLTEAGKVVFEEIQKDFPGVRIRPGYRYYSATIPYREGRT